MENYNDQKEEPGHLKTGFSRTENSIRERFDGWVRIAAFASLLSVPLAEAHASENIKTSNLSKTAEKAHTQQERIQDLKLISSLCKKYGFDFIDTTSDSVDVHLPPKEVTGVILFLGQSHALGDFKDNPPDMRMETAKKQQDIYTMFKHAYTVMGTKATCLLEGICDEKDIKKLQEHSNPSSYESYFLAAASDQNSSMAEVTEDQIEAVSKFATSLKNKEKEGLQDSILFDMVVALQKNLQKKVSPATKLKLEQAVRILEAHIDYDLLAYKLGGTILASRLGYVDIKPAEEKNANSNVAKQIYAHLGIKNTPEDFYTVINRQPKQIQKKAFELLGIYGMSKERELPAMELAEQALVRKDFVVLTYGAAHDFHDVLEDQYSRGRMQHTALVKIDTRKFKFKRAKK